MDIDAGLWELDDPLHRFATGALNLEHWADPEAPPTHRIFVDEVQFDEWLATLKPLGPLTARQVEEIVNPQLRAARAAAARRVKSEPSVFPGDNALPKAAASEPPGVGPLLLTVEQVSKLIGRSVSSIYGDRRKGCFLRRSNSARARVGARTKYSHGSRSKRQNAAGANAACGGGY